MRKTFRIPRSLHCKLHMLAEREGVSINALALRILAEELAKPKVLKWPDVVRISPDQPIAV